MEDDFPFTDQGKTGRRVSYFFDHDVGNVSSSSVFSSRFAR